MRLPENPADEYLSKTNHKGETYSGDQTDLIPKVPFDFGSFLARQKLECDRVGVDSTPQKIQGDEVHPALEGTEFEIYTMPWGKFPEGHRRKRSRRYLVGIKFTGQSSVDWAKYLQEVVLECEGVDEAREWLNLEAEIRFLNQDETPELKAFRLEADQNMGEIIKAIKGSVTPKKKQLRPGGQPLPKQATI